MKVKMYEEATQEFRKATELDPIFVVAYSNLSLALFHLGRLADAEAAARQILRLERTSPKAHYLLGLFLFLQNKFTPEALENLTTTSQDFPKARLLASEILIRQGRLKEAIQEIHPYLGAP